MQKGGANPLDDVESVGFLLWSFYFHIRIPAYEARLLIILSVLTPRLTILSNVEAVYAPG